MFSDTYGILYDRHASIFNDMFRDLETYYSNGKLDISIAMKNFFATLYKKMFEELNSQFAFDSRYLNCTVEHMEEMMPFGELPNKLIGQIRRSFVAVRTFVQALNYGSDILRTIADAPITSACESRLEAIRDSRRICNQACATAIEKACFPYLQALNHDWNLYLNDVLKLASRLKTSFNIELAVKPINIQISEAIMIFQENGVLISQTLFNKCGKPTTQNNTRRSRRDLYMYNGSNSAHRSSQSRVYSPNSYPTTQHHNRQNSHQSSPSPSSSSSSTDRRSEMSMEQLIGDIVRDFKSYKNFWPLLSKRVCSQMPLGSPTNCSSLTITNSQMPEVLSYRDRNSLDIVNRQTSILKAVSQNLKNAFNGFDVDLTNNLKMAESEVISVSSDDKDNGRVEGSGDKSNIDDDVEGDDDDDNEEHDGGSGDGSGDGEIIKNDPKDNQEPKKPDDNDTKNKGEGLFFPETNRTVTATPDSKTNTDNSNTLDSSSDSKSKPSSARIQLPFFGIIFFTLLISCLSSLFCSFLL